MVLESPPLSSFDPAQQQLMFVLDHIERELFNSDAYRTALASLQKGLGDAAESSQKLLKSVGREAIRLALQQLLMYFKETRSAASVNAPVNPFDNESNGSNQSKIRSSPFEREDEKTAAREMYHPIDASESCNPWDSNSNRREPKGSSSLGEKFGRGFNSGPTGQSPKKRNRKLTASELHEEAQKHWKNSVEQIGTQLKQAREQRFLSIEELHQKTLVPCRHIRAIEQGNVETLPEEVFIRNFIHKIADELGLDGKSLVISLAPAPQPLQKVSSGGGGLSGVGFEIRPLHLYLGYTALMASAIGGLAWMQEQAQSEPPVETDPVLTSPSSDPERTRESSHTPGLKGGDRHVSIGGDIAPPEVF
ncbi:helix-turn-helix domain-containing protein [Oxynema sp. CENA135]|uniref:helix-turn-helix domain-containing protein n=1 Tax=Oxynema sp. CENA135 TaxID=984206 RepID=UPI001909C69A|nr:helix-turn-helix domain-containing protein [Oxynema sp. CENA135]MBK4729245.1 helix-turn-helix domain-containing protein [Oxynema sp. CENA135]